MRTASMILLLCFASPSLAGFPGIEADSQLVPGDNREIVLFDASSGPMFSSIDLKEWEAKLTRSASRSLQPFAELVGGSSSTWSGDNRFSLVGPASSITALPLQLTIPMTCSCVSPVALRLEMAWQVGTVDQRAVNCFTCAPLEGATGELIPTEPQDEIPLTQQFAPVPYIEFPTMRGSIDEPVSAGVEEIVCIIFSAAAFLATLKEHQLNGQTTSVATKRIPQAHPVERSA